MHSRIKFIFIAGLAKAGHEIRLFPDTMSGKNSGHSQTSFKKKQLISEKISFIIL